MYLLITGQAPEAYYPSVIAAPTDYATAGEVRDVLGMHDYTEVRTLIVNNHSSEVLDVVNNHLKPRI